MNSIIMIIVIFMMITIVCGQNGPGRGPWVVVSPESQGLNTSDLEAAELEVLDRVPRRLCYLVVKNGYIVYEKYYTGWDETRIKQGYSTTKSHCSSLFGIATQQGFANTTWDVQDHNRDTRECNPDVKFSNVLTMTGESEDLSNPSFRYDTDGTRCLDCLSDFIQQNNPEGLTTEEYKDKYWHSVLGMEHSVWTSTRQGLQCGWTSMVSCRDMARAAQLWLNEGVWEGQQVMSRQHILTGRTFVYPTSRPPPGTQYGYTVWRKAEDNIDPDVHSFMGALSQCAHISKRHEAIVVSMGYGDVVGARCFFAWTETRDAIVSNDFDRSLLSEITETQMIEEMNPPAIISHEEAIKLYEIMKLNPKLFLKEEIQVMDEYIKSNDKN